VNSFEMRIAELEKKVILLLEAVAERDRIISERDARIVVLEKRVAELEAKLGQNSTNSHKPPSTDPPGTRPPKNRTGKRRGGQLGHKPHRRVRLPPEAVTRRTRVTPRECGQCGSTHVDLFAEPRWHQVADVPPPKPDVHEYVLDGGVCEDCGAETWAKLPDGVPQHMFGPRLLALIAFLVGSKMSRRRVQETLREVFGIPISLGALSEAEERVSTALSGPQDEALAHVRAERVKHVDATSWRQSGSARSLWTIATKLVTVFAITADATTASIREQLGRLRGFLVSDRASTFGFWAMAKRQVCWAHLIRKFVAFAERRDAGAELGEQLLYFAHLMLGQWHSVRDGTLARKRYQAEMESVRTAIECLLRTGERLDLPGLSGSCADMLGHRDALFTFIDVPGIEPTNNLAERSLREFVLWRKVSFGSQSDRGCLFAERVMTVFQTLRQQKRSVFAFLVDACHAAQHSLRPPSLLPITTR
jgi:transposase